MLVSVGGKRYPVRFKARPDARRPGTPMGTQGPINRLTKGAWSCSKSHSIFSDEDKRAYLKLEYPFES